MSILRLERNKRGRDFVVGDLHASVRRLCGALDQIGFNRKKDRLIVAGDLLDRGAEPDLVLELMQKAWFYAVLGNHDELNIRLPKGNLDIERFIQGGGEWNVLNPLTVQKRYASALCELPLAIEVETKSGIVGVVHAGCPCDSWEDLRAGIANPLDRTDTLGDMKHAVMWNRDRFKARNDTPVKGVRAVIAGHCTVKEPLVLGNTFFIDTGGWRSSGYFSFVELSTLQILKTT